ncbi:MAG: metal-sulfur cluster assembly factor [Acidobacteria bacterium]|nr:metal-sulfur cluster assembly factor [Acidobacteriota bacterium]MDW7985214.1 metal-sulfur cluster assembly factor [Acidobacteriota bacterium]
MGMTADQVWQVLQAVEDPELPVSIVDLGLVRGVQVEGDDVTVEVTFTAMGCPCMEWIQEDIRARLSRLPGVGRVEVRVVWDPPWTPMDMRPTAREALARYGVVARARARSRRDL